jgi:hypothetical protein
MAKFTKRSATPAPATKPAAPSTVGYKGPAAAAAFTTPAPAAKVGAPSKDAVAKRAYEIWVAKGRPVGKDLENWQQAERELSAALRR